MEIATGCTRRVLLTRNYAFKFARFKIFRPILRLFETTRDGEVKETLKHHHSNLILAGLRYLFFGFVSNRNEYLLYKNHGNDLLVPTLFTFFYIFNVQVRGESVVKEDLRGSVLSNLLRDAHFLLSNEILRSQQFCRINGVLLLADYAIDGFAEVMASYNANAKGVS